jgi:heat shock protein HtpX
MADSPDLFARRNRLRISLLVVLATLNYVIAVALATVAVVLTVVLGIVFEGGDALTDLGSLKWIGIGLAFIVVGSAAIGAVIGLVRIPFQRRRLQRLVLKETGAHIAKPEEHPQVRNLLEGLAIAAGLPAPKFAIIDDASPNSFGVGTRPSNTLVGVTTGLQKVLSRDELEAVLAYEVSRIRSWDVALASWTVALTSGAISAAESKDDDGALKSLFGYLPKRFGEWLQVWALRDQGAERDRAAVRFTRNPGSLIRALEKLDADATPMGGVTRATAPLWVEFPAQVLAGSSSKATRRLAKELLLDERIEYLRDLAKLAPAGQPGER